MATLGLLRYVELISGNFIERRADKFDFIFCDALHDPAEITLILPEIVKQKSNDSCVRAFHDMIDENPSCVLSGFNSSFVERIYTIAVFPFSSESASHRRRGGDAGDPRSVMPRSGEQATR